MASLLDRRTDLGLSFGFSHLNPQQLEQDQILANFSHEASDWKNLTAMMAGGLAYRLGKIGVYSAGANNLQILAPAIGLATEVTAFRGVNQILSPHPSPLTPHSSWLTDYINFGTLKIFGKISHGQNPILAHLFQDVGMVTGHQLAYGLNLATKPEGSLLQQLVHAEATNLALGAGTALAHQISGGKLLGLEKMLETRSSSLEASFSKQNTESFSASPSSQAIRMNSVLLSLQDTLYRDVNLPRPTKKKTNLVYNTREENEAELLEIARLHAEFIEGGGRLLVDPQLSPQEIYLHLAAGQPLIELGSKAVFMDSRWGRVDLRPLAEAHAYRYYPGNARQAELGRDLSILFNSLRIPVTHARSEWGESGPRIFRDNAWNNLPVTWQKFLWMLDQVNESSYQGEEGYDRFAVDHFEGYSQAAWKMARCLYVNRDEMKQALGWKRMKVTNVHQEAHLRAELLAGIESGNLQGEAGYDLWATAYFEGYSQRAGTAARQLLTPEQFKKLKWPYIKVTNVADQEKIRTFLRAGMTDGSLKHEAGYDRFAESEWFKGYSQRAWVAAKSLLSTEEFSQLEWPEVPKVASVKEQKYFRKMLLEGLEDGSLIGETGYDDFSETHFVGFSAYAWDIARSVLNPEQFAQLEWPRKKITNVKEQKDIRDLLREGLKDGTFFGARGLNLFAENYAGNKSKAWEVARTLLSDLEFLLLAWEAPEATAATNPAEQGAPSHHTATERKIIAAEAENISPHMLYRFLLVLNEKPKTLGKRLLTLLEIQYSDNPYVLALTQWLRKQLNHSNGKASSSPPSSSPAANAKPLSEHEALLKELLKALEEDPHGKAPEIMERLGQEIKKDPSVELMMEWMKQQLQTIPQKIKPAPAAPPPPPPPPPPQAEGDPPKAGAAQAPMRFQRINLKPESATLADIEELHQAVQSNRSATTCAPLLTPLIQVAFSDRSSVEARNRAGEILFENNSALLNLWREGVKINVGRELTPILGQRPAIKESYLKRILRTLSSALESGDLYTAAMAMSQATLLAANMKDKRTSRTLEDILLKHPLLTLRLAVFDAFTLGAKVILWDEYERLFVFEDLLSDNPNRQKMGFTMLQEFEKAEVASGTKTKSIARLLGIYLSSGEAVFRSQKAENCPEVSITRKGLSSHLFTIFTSPEEFFPGNFQAEFLDPLTERILTRVQGMSFFQLRELFFNEGGFSVETSAPYALIRQESIQLVRDMVQEGKIHPKRNLPFLQALKTDFDYMMDDLGGARQVPVGHLKFPEPRSFR